MTRARSRPVLRVPAAIRVMRGGVRILRAKPGSTTTERRPRRVIGLVPRTVRGRATAVVTLMAAVALAVSGGVLVYAVRHELVGTVLVAADGSGVTAGSESGSNPTMGPGPSDSTVPAAQVSIADPQRTDFALIDTAQGAMVRLVMIGIPLLILLIAALTWLAMGRALRPVEAIRAELVEITAHDLHRRVPDRHTGDEVSRLAATMNATLDQLQRAVARLRTFTSDASHELRGPLTTLLTRLELATARPDTADWPPVAVESLRDVEQLRQIVDDLLLLARFDAGQALRADTFVVSDVVRDAIRDRRAVVVCDEAGGQTIRGSRTAILRLVRNLVDNAVRYAESQVCVRLRCVGGRLILEVVDDGPGIDPVDRSRVFDRFVRLDEARTRSDHSRTGLGLAIAREIATAHDGTLTAEPPEPGHTGARLLLTVPVDR